MQQLIDHQEIDTCDFISDVSLPLATVPPLPKAPLLPDSPLPPAEFSKISCNTNKLAVSYLKTRHL